MNDLQASCRTGRRFTVQHVRSQVYRPIRRTCCLVGCIDPAEPRSQATMGLSGRGRCPYRNDQGSARVSVQWHNHKRSVDAALPGTFAMFPNRPLLTLQVSCRIESATTTMPDYISEQWGKLRRTIRLWLSPRPSTMSVPMVPFVRVFTVSRCCSR